MHFEARRIWRYPPGLQDILESDRLTDMDRENILWRNAERVFGVPPVKGEQLKVGL